MTITPNRLRELIRFADDRAADTTQDYQTIQAHRDIAAALRTLEQILDPANTAPMNVETCNE